MLMYSSKLPYIYFDLYSNSIASLFLSSHGQIPFFHTVVSALILLETEHLKGSNYFQKQSVYVKYSYSN